MFYSMGFKSKNFSQRMLFDWAEKFRLHLFKPRDVSSLALTRIVLGILFLLDTVHERGLSHADIIWQDEGPNQCRFPLFPMVQPMSSMAMYAVYAFMVLALIGFILGFYYRLCTWTYVIAYWYLFLLDRSRWNNHSYLFGLLAVMFATNQSNSKWSLDVYFGRIQKNSHVPYHQYFILQFQIFLVYFYAGLKKTNPDWLMGYSMVNLSDHWIFRPVTVYIPEMWIDYVLIHIGGFVFDTSVGFLFLYPQTRWLGFILCSIFNLINSQLFQIGMFPWVMLALMPIYCSQDWPERLYKLIRRQKDDSPQLKVYFDHWNWKKQITLVLLIVYLLIQVSLPFAFLMLRGYNTWTTGIYGYNWDMMVHNWNNVHVKVKIEARNPATNKTIVLYVKPEGWTTSRRWSHHADMVKQFVHCVEHKLTTQFQLSDIKAYLDVWISLNGRFAQRMYDPNRDLISAPWSPLTTADWVMPIIPTSNKWRSKFESNFRQFDSIIQQNLITGTWAIFLADFPGYTLENSIEDIFEDNIRLLVFDGNVSVTILDPSENVQTVKVKSNQQLTLKPGSLVNITVTGKQASYYALLYPKIHNYLQMETLDAKPKQRNVWISR